VLLLVWAASAVYVSGFVARGWVPHDEGMLGQSAERVLRGELPHSDFDESYTGGLAYGHALAFRALGVRLLSLRVALFVGFLLFVPLFYALAARLLPPWPAALATLVAVAWSLPNYFASMPSWYVLFFSLLGSYAVLRHIETGRRLPLFAAGLCASAGILVIIVGLYFVAAVLLFLVFREQELSRARSESSRGAAFFAFEAAALAAFLASVLALARSSLSPMSALHFVVPAAAVCALLLRRAWALRRAGRFGERFRALAALVAPFAAGVSLPILLFAAFYAGRGGLSDLTRGLFVLPMRQVRAASLSLPPLPTFAAALPYALALVLSTRSRRRAGPGVLTLVAAALVLLLVLSSSEEAYRLVWHSARSLGVVAVLVGCMSLLRGNASEEAPASQETFLLLSVAALLALLQFPYAAPIYFCYVAPVVVLALSAVARRGRLLLHGIVAGFYLAFAVWRLNPGYVWNLGVRPAAYGPLAPLGVERGGLRVPASDAQVYRTLVAAIGTRSRGPYVYAAPDCPEVDFLAARLSPTRVSFDYLREPPTPQALLRRLRETMVTVVVLNTRPDYSDPISPALHTALESEFPNAERIGKFELRWRP